MKALQDEAVAAAILKAKAEKLVSPEKTKANIIKYAKQVAEEAHIPERNPDYQKALLRKVAWLDRIVANIELAKYAQLEQVPKQLILDYI